MGHGASEPLRALADDLGVATDYWDWQGRHVDVDAASIVAVLRALGQDASSDEAAAASLDRLRLDRWRRTLPPCVVVRMGSESTVPVHVVHGSPVTLTAVLEDGSRRSLQQVDRWVDPLTVDDVVVGEATFALPSDLPTGYHRLVATAGVGGDAGLDAPLLVVPSSLPPVEQRCWGLAVQLYATRSARSWGLGDLSDLKRIVTWAAGLGAGFVLVNPLHAAVPATPVEPSPYLPATRRFPDPAYVCIEDVPEVEALDEPSRRRLEALSTEARALVDAELLDRDAAWALRLEAMTLLAAVPLRAPRQAAYDEFMAREGEELLDFAAWWAAQAGSTADVCLRGQWWLDEQLGAVADAASDGGMSIGLMVDLAVGSSADGFDMAEHADLLAAGVTVGAPPDAFNQVGQDWSQPPFRPDRLAGSGYAPYVDLVRSVLRHGGGVRVDHVMGLFRLWWIPEETAPSAGTYVRLDHEALVGILLLEAERAGAIVVGEDLGVVEPWVRDHLRERGVNGTSVIWFERGWSGEPLAPEHWREACLATVTTHDLPPTAGYLLGAHVDVRARLNLLERPVEEERAAFEAERDEWLETLRGRGLLSEDSTGTSAGDALAALHAYVAQTPSRLVGVSLADVVGDTRAVNQPGTHAEYPNWCVPLADGSGRHVLVDDLESDERWARRVRELVSSLDTLAP